MLGQVLQGSHAARSICSETGHDRLLADLHAATAPRRATSRRLQGQDAGPAMSFEVERNKLLAAERPSMSRASSGGSASEAAPGRPQPRTADPSRFSDPAVGRSSPRQAPCSAGPSLHVQSRAGRGHGSQPVPDCPVLQHGAVPLPRSGGGPQLTQAPTLCCPPVQPCSEVQQVTHAALPRMWLVSTQLAQDCPVLAAHDQSGCPPRRCM